VTKKSERYPVLVLGGGKIGSGIARRLQHSGDYDVVVGDISVQALEALADEVPVSTQQVDVADHQQLLAAMQGRAAVVSACSFAQNRAIAQAALEAGISYFDLTEDIATTNAVREIAGHAAEGQVFMPQCGLAPGFIGILAHDLCQQFDKIDRVKMRVGALPLYPANMLKYNLTWSTDGLINEYCNPCEAIRDGQQVSLQPLEGLERFALDGVDYEAFNTSGGLGTLCETLNGRVTDLDYKTVRYKGHQYLMMFLLEGLRFRDRRDLLKELLEASIPCTQQDVVLVFATVTGWRNGRFEQLADARKVYHADMDGQHSSSIQITTATSVCAVVDLFRTGKLPTKGFLRQEDVSLRDFLDNQFGTPYRNATKVHSPVATDLPII
jgi:saccharopine dehydrogenase-like NADP-dependent oxidoreductase